MESREVHWHIRAELLDDPPRHGSQLVVRIIFAGDQKGRDLEPNVGFAFEIHKCIEHRLQMACANIAVKVLRKRSEIDVGGVLVSVEFCPGLGADFRQPLRQRT